MTKFVIATGGTGGHIFPAQALAQDLRQKDPSIELLFMGKGLKTNPFFKSYAQDCIDIASASISLKHPWKNISSFFKLLKGLSASLRILKQYNPDRVIAFGSFYVFPILLASRILRIPIILHEQNALPGQVNKLFSRKAFLTATVFPASRRYLKGKVELVKMPLKLTYQKQQLSLPATLFNSNLPTILVFGGSQGALSINRVFTHSLKRIKNTIGSFQVIHLFGLYDHLETLKSIYVKAGIDVYLSPFEENMLPLWEKADLVIARAGAMTISEMIYKNVPGILIPYPYAKDNHQNYNADFMVEEVKGGVKLLESELSSETLTKAISDFFANRFAQLNSYRANISAFNQAQKAEDFSVCVLRGIS